MLTTVGNSLENGIAGKYDLHIQAILQEAWQKNKGFKGKFWGASALAFLIFIALVLVETGITVALAHFSPSSHLDKIAEDVFRFFNNLIVPLFNAGLLLLGIRHMSGQAIRSTLVFRGWKVPRLFWNLVLAAFIFYVFAAVIGIFLGIGIAMFHTNAMGLKIIGAVVGVIAACLLLYFLISYSLTAPLIIERELGTWRAFSISIRAITKHWFKVFGLYFMIFLLTALGLITLGIGFIWIFPMIYNIYGIMYREIVGAQVRPLEEM